MSSHLYREIQKIRQPWIYALLIIVLGLWIWQFVQQILMGKPFGTNPAPDIMVILIGIIPLGAFWLIFSLKLETIITNNGIKYRMWPLIPRFREVTSGEIARWEVRKYNPIKDYGGWGIRYGWGKNGTAYNMSGNQGAYFELKNGKRFLIGTQKPEELRAAIRKMMAAEAVD